MEPKYSPAIRWILYLVSFFGAGWLGLVIGIFLMTRGDEESKVVGKNCLIAWVASIVIGCVCGICGVIFPILMSVASGSSALLLPLI